MENFQFQFQIQDWSAWAPGFYSSEEWISYGHEEEVDNFQSPQVKELPMMQRRRLKRLGRMALRTALDVTDDEDAYLVFSSRYGDSENTVQLLCDLANGESLSPAKFSISVHNALAGMFSIFSKNKMPHTAISAGQNSFHHALLECISLLKEDLLRTIVLVHYDEPLPEFYDEGTDIEVPAVSFAMKLTSTSTVHMVGSKKSLVLDVSKNSQPTASRGDDVFSFIQFLLGNQMSWDWSLGTQQWKCKLNVE